MATPPTAPVSVQSMHHILCVQIITRAVQNSSRGTDAGHKARLAGGLGATYRRGMIVPTSGTSSRRREPAASLDSQAAAVAASFDCRRSGGFLRPDHRTTKAHGVG